MRYIKIIIAYDGTNYNGWQRQKNAVGIEQVVENACREIFKQDIKIIGASRTDTGVHALGQIAVFKIKSSIPTERIPYALNTKLPDDIVVHKAEAVNEDFHPRYSAKQKTYQYLIYNASFMMPQYRNYMAFEAKTLNFKAIEKASKYFIGTNDFKGFCSTGSSVKTTIRTIYNIDLTNHNNIIKLNITGNGFLYNMVRIIAGTLIEVGKQKILPEHVPCIIKSKDRTRAGKTAPACGLTLVNIEY